MTSTANSPSGDCGSAASANLGEKNGSITNHQPLMRVKSILHRKSELDKNLSTGVKRSTVVWDAAVTVGKSISSTVQPQDCVEYLNRGTVLFKQQKKTGRFVERWYWYHSDSETYVRDSFSQGMVVKVKGHSGVSSMPTSLRLYVLRLVWR